MKNKNKQHNVVIAIVDEPFEHNNLSVMEQAGALAGALQGLVGQMYEENDPRNGLLMVGTKAVSEIAMAKLAAKAANEALIACLAKNLEAVEAYERARYGDMPSLSPVIEEFSGLKPLIEEYKNRRESEEAEKTVITAIPPKADKPDEKPDENEEFFASLLNKLKNDNGPKN